jgi:low affinity Fe/Cu permease
MTNKNQRQPSGLERIALKSTEWVGSTNSLIVHTCLFVGIFALHLFDVPIEEILLILTTAVSLEAIYLAVFIQMTVNRNTQSLEEVEEDIDEIQEGVEELEHDIDEIQEDIVELTEDDAEEEAEGAKTYASLTKIEGVLQQLINDIEAIKNSQPK